MRMHNGAALNARHFDGRLSMGTAGLQLARPRVRAGESEAMEYTMVGIGNAVSGGQTAAVQGTWPFPFPPVVGMPVRWVDSNTNHHFGEIVQVIFDLNAGKAEIQVQVNG